MKEIKIDMTVYNCENETQDSLSDKFIEWVESNGWLCGGMVEDVTKGKTYKCTCVGNDAAKEFCSEWDGKKCLRNEGKSVYNGN